jgi:hypothetical protein
MYIKVGPVIAHREFIIEEPAKLNRNVAMRALWPYFIKTYTIMQQTKYSRYLIDFSYEKSAGRHRQCFLLDKSCRKMHTIFSAVLRQLRKSDVMTSIGHSARNSVYPIED